MDVQLGYALLRDRRVPLRPKLIALAIGAAVVGFTELLQMPLESLFAVILPIFGIAGDVVLDGVEAVFGPCSSPHCSCPSSRPTLLFTGFPAHIAQRFTPVGNRQLFRVVCEASQFEAQFTLCEKANYERFFGAVRRAAKKLGQGLKLSHRELRQFKLIPAF